MMKNVRRTKMTRGSQDTILSFVGGLQSLAQAERNVSRGSDLFAGQQRDQAHAALACRRLRLPWATLLGTGLGVRPFFRPATPFRLALIGLSAVRFFACQATAWLMAVPRPVQTAGRPA